MNGHRAKKRFGQNFLVDRAVVAAIVRAIEPAADGVLVEIGPGLAALTDPLLAARDAATPRRPLHAIELDRDLAGRLQRRHAVDRLVVHQADALAFDFATLLPEPGDRLRIVGNLPYNISTPLLFHLGTFVDRVIDQHFMLQKEVVARMVAEPGAADYGRLSVMLQAAYHLESLFDVPPEAFDPPPKVTSAIVRMIPAPTIAATIVDPVRFADVVRLAFSQRRKMLRNTLADHAAAMEAVGIAATARAEEVSPERYIALANFGAR